MRPGLLDRDTLLRQAHLLITSDKFDHQANARANALMTLAQQLNGGHAFDDPELRSFSDALRAARPAVPWQPPVESVKAQDRLRQMKQTRDLGETSLPGGYLVPQAFRDLLQAAMAAYNRIFDEDVCWRFETDTGATMQLPAIDDTSSAAVQVGEGVQTVVIDPTAEQVTLPAAVAWRSGMVNWSFELNQDSKFPATEMLGLAFGIRFARGIGPTFTSALLAAAKLGATAAGDPNKTGATGANSIGYPDLLALRTSINPAYRAAAKVWWLMNDSTLSALDTLTDKNGRPILHPLRDENGNRLLLDFPVGLCPSMPSIGAGATPVLFGATGYFVVRDVSSGTRVQVITERYAEYGQVAFQGYKRMSGALLCASGADSPVKFLQNAA